MGLPLGKPLAALCYVALEPSAVARSDLGAVLWPASPESRAKASIRQAHWLVRKPTAPEALSEEEGDLRIDPALLATDLSAFEAAPESERLDEAVALWNGGLLQNLSIPDAQPWLSRAEDVRSRWEGRALSGPWRRGPPVPAARSASTGC